jgi:hypothetical protein
MASIDFSLISFSITNTRSLHEDTDYVSVGLKVNQNPVLVQTKRIGNVNNGTHQVNLTISIPGETKDTDEFVFSYLVINHGGGKADAVLADCATVMTMPGSPLTTFAPAGAAVVQVGGLSLPTSLATQLRAADNIDALWNPVKAVFKNISSDHCDGPVAIDQFSFFGSSLSDVIRYTTPNNNWIYEGIDSAVGCGSNSAYAVTWASRVLR